MSQKRLTAEKRMELGKEYLRGETSYEKIVKKYGDVSTAEETVAKNELPQETKPK